jgi:hypothetical protein
LRKAGAEWSIMMLSSTEAVCAMMKATSPGAQTERRGDARPVRDLLGGKPHRPIYFYRMTIRPVS